MRIVGVVLAGGQSRRFGEPKALALWQEDALLSYSVRALQAVTNEILVISHLQDLPVAPNVVVLEDIERYRGMGPLAGILTAMKAVEGDWYVVLPCDVPLVTGNALLALMSAIQEDTEAVVPIVAERKQPLLACYHKNVKSRLEALLKNDKRSMKELLSQCTVIYVTEEQLGVEADMFRNVNTKEEYMGLP